MGAKDGSKTEHTIILMIGTPKQRGHANFWQPHYGFGEGEAFAVWVSDPHLLGPVAQGNLRITTHLKFSCSRVPETGPKIPQ